MNEWWERTRSQFWFGLWASGVGTNQILINYYKQNDNKGNKIFDVKFEDDFVILYIIYFFIIYLYFLFNYFF